ncbi:uncharacterized protein LOC144714170 isoform X1 [Wolffia australiana]
MLEAIQRTRQKMGRSSNRLEKPDSGFYGDKLLKNMQRIATAMEGTTTTTTTPMTKTKKKTRRGICKGGVLFSLFRAVAGAMASSAKPAGGGPVKEEKRRPAFFLSSTGSLEGFLVEVPKQMGLRPCPGPQPPHRRRTKS